jgi:hypothetical protein
MKNNLQIATIATNVTIGTNATFTTIAKNYFSSSAWSNDKDVPTLNPRLLLGVDRAAKLSTFDNTERYRHNQALSFRDDGSVVLKYGSTTIIKNGSIAVIKGSLVNSFKDDSVQNIKRSQDFFLNSLKNIKSTYNINKDVYDESTPILSIRYIKTCKMMIEESLENCDSSENSNSIKKLEGLGESAVVTPITEEDVDS